MRTGNTRRNRGKPVTLGIPILWLLAVLWIAVISISVIGSDVYASSIQTQPPAKIFAASCSTCHGGKGLGGVTFVKDGPGDNRTAPKIAGKAAKYTKSFVRAGAPSGAMPAFGREEITDAELNDLANWLQSYPAGVPAPTLPDEPTARRLDILDADPWFWDDNSDTGVSTYSGDRRRVQLSSTTHYLKVVNTGRTWHTLTSAGVGKDSGFIGYAGNYRTTPGDMDQSQGIGYYYADPDTDLASGCHEYYCKMHPYMAVEVCVDDAPGPLTRASKNPIGLPAAGTGKVWVSVQSQEEANELGTTTVNSYNSVNDMDGVYQVINAANFAAGTTYIKNVGNNPHNAWPGKDGSGNPVVMQASWHDNTVSVMDATANTLIRERRSGATNAHMMAVPNNSNRFYVTHMGGRAVQELDVDKLIAGFDPNIGGVIRGATGPHGLWFCDDNTHILTADTFGNSATLYNIGTKNSKTAGSGGASPLAPSIMGGFTGGWSGAVAGCSRGFTNNAGTADVSIYKITGDNISRDVQTAVDVPAPGVDYNAAGNIQLRDTTSSGAGDPVRWASLPIQTPVSPSDSAHGRYVVTANKASFNVSVTALSTTTGLPTALYTFPAGLGAHGVTYGPKTVCTAAPCYYAYVTNTFEGGRNGGTTAGYVSVYDLEKIPTAGLPGTAFALNPVAIADNTYTSDSDTAADGLYINGTTITGETATVEGAAAGIVICDLLGTTLCNALGFGAYDILGGANTASADTGQLDDNGFDNVAGGGDDCAIVQATGLPDNTLAPSDSNTATDGGPNGLPDVVELAICMGLVAGTDTNSNSIPDTNVGALGTAWDVDSDGTYPDLIAPITALCPDCRSGVHVGDIPLKNAPGLTSDSTEYTYYKTTVWVDDVTPFLGLGGQINQAVSDVDLDLQINSGGQGIVASPAATPFLP